MLNYIKLNVKSKYSRQIECQLGTKFEIKRACLHDRFVSVFLL